MLIKRTWAARLAALTLGSALACVSGIALADEGAWGLDGEALEDAGVVGEAPEDLSQLSEEALLSESASQTEASSQVEALATLQVNAHSQEEIKGLYQVANLNLSEPIVDAEAPSTEPPFAAGTLSDRTITQATGLVNFYRYVAGLDAVVIPNADYNAQAQAAALLMAVNHSLAHTGQEQPDGMSDELYQLGSDGCARSNIAMGYDTLQDAIMGWIDDGGTSNIANVGHRRWILNPTMGQTGFGAVSMVGAAGVPLYSAMYAFDRSNTEASQTMVAWPAQNTPLELVESDVPWSVSFNSPISSETVQVQVQSVATGQTWNFSSEAADGAFYVSNAHYGSLTGCVIFQPTGIDISEGQSYDVTITGVEIPVQYRVNFFYVTEPLTSITVNSPKLQNNGNGILMPDVTVKSGDTVLVEGEDYLLSMSSASAPIQTVTATGIRNYHGTVSTTFTPESSDNGHVTIDRDDPQLPGRWVASQGKWWYQYIDGTYPRSTWLRVNGQWYFFDEEGWMLTGWQLIDGDWYYMNGSGAMQTGWQNVGGTWFYLQSSGVMQTGWLSLGNTWYYLKSNGAMAIGWEEVDGIWYHMDTSGAIQTGWQSVGGAWYYFNDSGAMQTGWLSLGGAWYYLAPSGAMATGWQEIHGTWYYFASSGRMLTGWHEIGGNWYYMNASGAMQTNRWIGNYYVTESGAMAKDTWIGEYHVNNSGLWDDAAE